jgi:L-ascorbate metabolism protein UlaG (beta-lactamase superfamily)
MVPMHYGSFKLSFEDLDEPPRWLEKLAHANGLSHHLKILEEGYPTVF